MENRNFFKDMYDDFFGIEKIKEQNEKLREELGLNKDIPAIEVKKESNEQNNIPKELSKEEKDSIMKELYVQIDELYIKEDSKKLLKKIIEYQRKYNENIEKQYIPFNMCIFSSNKEDIEKILNIMEKSLNVFGYIKSGKRVNCSFYDVDKVDKLDEIYSSNNSIIVFKDFESLLSSEKQFQDKVLHKIENKVSDNSIITILVASNKDVVEQALLNNSSLKDSFFEIEVYEQKPDIQEVYQQILNKLKESSNVTEEFEVKLLDYVSITYPNTELSYPDYRDKTCQKILFNKKDEITKEDIPEYEKEKTTEEIFAELNELVGLKKVKQVLKDLVSLMELKSKTEGELKLKETNLHMVFLGNPGTGKTTVARLVAQILYNLKYIKQNKLIEVSSKDLVAEYVGQTAPKTMAVVEKALGGVLFIDEAYSLASGLGQSNSYNEEAIATLIQAMENNRNNLVVIFAGYTKEMQAFLNSNSGIVSRIGYTLEFEDYTVDELIEIFKNMLHKAGFEETKEAIDEARKIIIEYKDSNNFGNARFVRNLYEKTVIKHASNTKGKKSKKILKTIDKKDISAENLLK